MPFTYSVLDGKIQKTTLMLRRGALSSNMVLEEWKTLMCLAVLKHAMSYIIEIFKAGNEELFHIGLHIQKPLILYIGTKQLFWSVE